MAISTATYSPSLFMFFPSAPLHKTPITRLSTKTLITNSTAAAAAAATTSIPSKKVLVPIGFGTEEMEAVILVDVMRRAGAEVTVASVEKELEIEASGGTRIVADTSISTCADRIFDLVALPGGMPGSARLRDCKILQEITSKQAEEKRLYGAICAAPAVTLLPWGLLRRKHAIEIRKLIYTFFSIFHVGMTEHFSSALLPGSPGQVFHLSDGLEIRNWQLDNLCGVSRSCRYGSAAHFCPSPGKEKHTPLKH